MLLYKIAPYLMLAGLRCRIVCADLELVLGGYDNGGQSILGKNIP